MASFGDLLKNFKEKERDNPESIIPLVDDAKLRMALVAWQSVKISYKDISECAEKDSIAQWEWLWNQISYDQSSFATVAGVQIHEATNILIRLKGLKLIYPDGTINVLAKQYLQGLILAKMPKRKKSDG